MVNKKSLLPYAGPGVGLYCSVEVRTVKSTRFESVVEKCGKPATHLLWTKPAADKELQKALKEDRVMTIKQETTGKKRDFGVIGLLEEKNVSYLIFPKSLKRYESDRIIGIKYELIEQAPVGETYKPTAKQRTAPKPKSKTPKEKRFLIRLRITVLREEELVVEAGNVAAARNQAIEQVQRDHPEGQIRILEAREAKAPSK